jgi:protein-disulfide isomerase
MRRQFASLAGALVSFANVALAQVQTDLGDMLVGRADAPVVIEAYLSLADARSADVYLNVLPVLKTRHLDTGRAKLLYREFPNADLDIGATLVSRCGGDDKRALLVDLLFRNQARWTNAGPKPVEPFIAVAGQAGLRREAVLPCLGDALMYGAIAAQRGVFMAERGIEKAPAFVVQGRRVQGVDLAAIEQAVAAVGQ